MKCATCGMEYGMTHNCAGARPDIVLPAIVAQETAPPSPGLSPIHYIREAFRIAVWNGDAIQRVSRDPNALRYGIAIWIVANSIPVLASAERSFVTRQMLAGFILLLTLRMLLSLAQIGVCFLLAKLFMGGEGRFVQILRPLLLGSIVLILMAIPYVGIFAAAIAWICVFAMVFQVVADVESFSAYILSIAVGVGFREIETALASAFG